MIEVVSLNISEKKGTVKNPVDKIILDKNGVVGDAHAGQWNRQVSLLSQESIKKFEKQINRKIGFGEFAENITTQGINLFETLPLDRLVIGECEIEVTQIGKKCHGTSCQIFKTTGDCIMPKEGVFARVVKGGEIIKGVALQYIPRIFKVLVVTLSDRASKGEYKDISGPILMDEIGKFMQGNNRNHKSDYIVISDDQEKLIDVLYDYAKYDIIFTTGSTGLGPRDIAPDAILPFIDKEIPGIMDMIRMKYGMEKPKALISRSIAGVKDRTLIYALPGHPKAIKEYTAEIFKTLQHSLYMLHGLDIHK